MNAVNELLTLQNLDITDTDLYVRNGYPWAAWDLLREQAPVFWYQRPHHEPFWAITKHEDVGYISRNPASKYYPVAECPDRFRGHPPESPIARCWR